MQSIIYSALKYFAGFLILYISLTLLLLVPSVSSLCNQTYALTTEFFFKKIFSKVHLQLQQVDDSRMIKLEYISKKKFDEQLKEAKKIGKKKTTISALEYRFNFHNLFLSFFVFLISLIILSPITIKEKVINLLIGSVLLYFYSLFKVFLVLFGLFNTGDSMYHAGESVVNLVKSILYFMTLSTNVLVVLIIWGILVFRKNNWKEFLSN